MLRGSHAPSSPALHYFGDARCRSIWQWQLIIALTVVTISVGVALLTPQTFNDWRFSVGVGLVVLITISSLGIPWHRIGQAPVFALPAANAFAIALIAAGGTPAASYLWVFPVSWAAAYYSTSMLIVMLGLVGALRLLNLFTLGITPETTINAVILLTALGFVGVIMAVGAERNRSSRRLLSAQSDRLAHALQRVNEQKARNKRLLDTLDVGIARVSTTGLVEISNNAFHRIYAIDVAAYFHPNRAVEYRTRRGAPVPAGETTLMRAARGELFENEVVWLFGLDGNWRAMRATTKAVDHGVANDGVLLLVEDVTEAVDPDAGENAKRRTISHELRNPLTAILGHIDLLLERDDIDEAVHEQLSVVERAGTRMQLLIDQALSTPHKHDDDADVDFDLADIARASLEAFRPAAHAAGVTVESTLVDPLPVHGDAFRLRQVIDNVIGNAIKYAQRGGRVGVRGTTASAGADGASAGEVSLLVSDTGIGIAADDIPRIFDRDYRTEAARRSGIPGTGLGLSISREIVLAHGGRFEVTSELGQGTEVTLVLPSSALERSAPERTRA